MNRRSLTAWSLCLLVPVISLSACSKDTTPAGQHAGIPSPVYAPPVPPNPDDQIVVKNNVLRGPFSVSFMGKLLLPIVLEDTGLPELTVLKEFGGNQALTPSLCHTVYKKYRELHPGEQDLHEDHCNWDTAHAGGSSGPLMIAARQLSEPYLVVLIHEQAPGTKKLFTAIHNIHDGKTYAIDVSQVEGKDMYFASPLLWIVSDTDTDQINASYNVETNELNVRPTQKMVPQT